MRPRAHGNPKSTRDREGTRPYPESTKPRFTVRARCRAPYVRGCFCMDTDGIEWNYYRMPMAVCVMELVRRDPVSPFNTGRAARAPQLVCGAPVLLERERPHVGRSIHPSRFASLITRQFTHQEGQSPPRAPHTCHVPEFSPSHNEDASTCAARSLAHTHWSQPSCTRGLPTAARSARRRAPAVHSRAVLGTPSAAGGTTRPVVCPSSKLANTKIVQRDPRGIGHRHRSIAGRFASPKRRGRQQRAGVNVFLVLVVEDDHVIVERPQLSAHKGRAALAGGVGMGQLTGRGGRAASSGASS